MANFVSVLGAGLAIAEGLAGVVTSGIQIFETGNPVAVPPIRTYIGGQHIEVDIKLSKIPS